VIVEKKNLLGIQMDALERRQAADAILEAGRQRQPLAVSAMAVHGIMTGVLDRTHRYRLNHVDLLVADGQPVRWALNWIHRVGLKERVYGPSLMHTVLLEAQAEGLPIFFYGCTPQILQLMGAELRKKYPGLQIAGMEPSKFRFLTPDEAADIAAQIRHSGAQILFLGIGCPRQEVWAYEFRSRLDLPIVAVGAAFAFAAGTVPQAPQWMQNRGWEWMFRLCMEPRRLWRRYLLLSPMYIFLVVCQRLGIKFSTAGTEPTREVLHG